MVMHHIVDTKGVLAKPATPFKAGGWLAITDLDPDGGEFHNDPAGIVHNGFEREDIKAYFRDAGLPNVSDRTADSFEKEVAEAEAPGAAELCSVSTCMEPACGRVCVYRGVTSTRTRTRPGGFTKSCSGGTTCQRSLHRTSVTNRCGGGVKFG